MVLCSFIKDSVLADCPFLTLNLFKDLKKWSSFDSSTSKSAMRKVDNHCDYLSGRNVVLSLASDLVDAETKTNIAKALTGFQKPKTFSPGKPELPKVYDDSKLEEFVTEDSWLIFHLLKIEPTFLTKNDFNSWKDDASYNSFCKLVGGFSSVNDAGERAVKFASDFSGHITKSKQQHQKMLQGIEMHRLKHTKAAKKTV